MHTSTKIHRQTSRMDALLEIARAAGTLAFGVQAGGPTLRSGVPHRNPHATSRTLGTHFQTLDIPIKRNAAGKFGFSIAMSSHDSPVTAAYGPLPVIDATDHPTSPVKVGDAIAAIGGFRTAGMSLSSVISFLSSTADTSGGAVSLVVIRDGRQAAAHVSAAPAASAAAPAAAAAPALAATPALRAPAIAPVSAEGAWSCLPPLPSSCSMQLSPPLPAAYGYAGQRMFQQGA
jgi:hypothetical protein